jgi:hypothetical protein
MIRAALVAVVAAVPALLVSACGGDEPQPASQAVPAAVQGRLSAKVDHPFVPLRKVRSTVIEGTEDGKKARVESRVRRRPGRVAGSPVTVVEVTESEDGEVVERTEDYYAQDTKGNVWYMGERVDDYKDGKLVGHGGEWLAGKDGAKPGLFMPARPRVGRKFEQERAPGVAEDESEVVEVGLSIQVPAGRFSDCIRTKDVAPLDDVTEFKFYCAGVGLIREDPPGGRVELVSYR